MAALTLALPAGALAKDGSATVRGKTLKVIAENTNLAEPGDLPEWRKAYIYIRVADSSYRGWDGSDIGVDVTGKYRVADVGAGSMVAGQGCIMGRTIFGNESHSVAFCEPSAVQRIVIKTANGNDGVKLESIDPNYSVPATVASTISTGKGHDGVLGGSGPDKINTGGDNDGGTEDPNTQAPESVSGNGGNDNINLSTSDTFNTDESDLFPYQAAHGGDGNDTIVTKGAFFDKIFGDDGEDRLVGGKGPDTIYGGAGDDYIRAANGDNQVYGQDGADSLGGGGGSDELYGGPGDDSFNSGSGDDMIDASDDQGKDSKIRCGGGSFDTLYFDSADGDPAAWKDCEDKTAQ